MSGLELFWLGQSGFRLRDPDVGPVVYVDPYLLKRESRTWQAPIEPEELANADVILCTHEHTDHFDRPSIERAARVPGAHFTLVVPRPIVPDAIALGIPAERVIGAQPDEPIDLPGVRVLPVPARHGINVADAYTFGTELSEGLVRYLGFVIEMGGVRAYHAGDCIPYPGQVERVKALAPHLALLPINGRDFFRETERNLVGNMDPREAARVARDIGAHVLIPMHWDMFPHNPGHPRELLGLVATEMPELTVLVMGRAATVRYAPPGS